MIAVLYQLNVESDNPDKWQAAVQACVACHERETRAKSKDRNLNYQAGMRSGRRKERRKRRDESGETHRNSKKCAGFELLLAILIRAKEESNEDN